MRGIQDKSALTVLAAFKSIYSKMKENNEKVHAVCSDRYVSLNWIFVKLEDFNLIFLQRERILKLSHEKLLGTRTNSA